MTKKTKVKTQEKIKVRQCYINRTDKPQYFATRGTEHGWGFNIPQAVEALTKNENRVKVWSIF